MKWLNLLWTMLLDERGEDNPEGGEPKENKDGETDTGGEPEPKETKPDPEAEPENKEGEEEQSEESEEEEGTPTEPKYGEFGDDPHEAAIKAMDLINSLKDKGGATEKNLAAIRKAAGDVGLSFLRDEEGNVTLKMKEEEKTTVKDKRFTDEHRELVGDEMVGAMTSLFQDKFDEAIAGYEKKQTEQRTFAISRQKSIGKMFKLYPSLKANDDSGAVNAGFNETFFNRANAILREKYQKNPLGDMMAAHEASIEMAISPMSLEEANKSGYAKAKKQKKVLGPAGGGSGTGAQGAAGGKLTQEQYLALTPEKRERYEKEQMGIKGT